MGTITRSFANLITASGPSAVADGTIVNADINASAAIDASKLTGISSQPFKNIVINGDMQIAQRSTSVASITTAGYYTVDRMNLNISSLGTWTQSQSTDTPTGQGFANSLKLDCTTADASPAAGDFMIIQQKFEGQNLQYLKKGTANALTLTASFWVKSTKTGTFILELEDVPNSRQVSKSYTVNTTNTWEFKTITFPADTTGTIANNNAVSLQINFWLGAGSTFSSGTLNTTWASITQANRAVGQVNIADSTDNEWYITGVQLEAGTSATDFEFLPIDVSFVLAKRYFQSTGTVPIIAYATAGCLGFVYQVEMRTTPTITFNYTGTANRVYNIEAGTTSDLVGTTIIANSYCINHFYAFTPGSWAVAKGTGFNTAFKLDAEL